ncbi:MAG: GNAT family N-acetyltransferase, partial [Solirubrobacterales bacterium]|nr:GNAT family N-acetyltransferase [Solirubrobacterales bacterium]
VSLRYPSFERWLASRSANFRSNARRNLSRFREAGGSSRLSTPATLADDIELFIELHRTRWQELTARGAGESRLLALGDRLPRLLRELGDALLTADRFHLRILEVRGRPVGAELSIAAGGEIDTVNYGWDGRFRRASPLAVGLLERIDEGIRRGEHRMSLGRSLSRFKLGFADGRAPVTRSVVVPVGAGLPAALARAAPQVARRRLRDTARRVLSEQHFEALRAANTRTRNAIARKGPAVERGDPN